MCSDREHIIGFLGTESRDRREELKRGTGKLWG